ncbi:MAG: rod shape-determining protein MreD [Gammaproteobacteria bacterium]|nr:rod shape-determining protein MreD [Gammaproteobacteria bacterium]
MSEIQRRGGSTILTTFVVALALVALPLPDWARWMRPEWATLVLIYWCLALPGRVNVGVGWMVGLFVDVITGNLLGQHALALSIVAFVTVKVHKQVRVYPLWQQALSVFVLVALGQLLVVWVKGIIGQAPEDWLYWVPSLTSALLWPWVYIVLRDARRKFRVAG